MASNLRLTLVLTLAVALGCAGRAEEEAAPTGGDDASTTSGLSAEDMTLVAAQKVCPVSGEPLEAMGDPYRVEVDGRVVFTCCEDCAAEVKKDPDMYLAKLDAAKTE